MAHLTSALSRWMGACILCAARLAGVIGLLAATMLPSGAAAAGTLYAIVDQGLGTGFDTFGTVNTGTGAFTPLGNALLPTGPYAPVYDPTTNAFYMTAQPLSGPNGLSNGIGRIDATTGAQSFINVGPNGFVTLNGVAVATGPNEPATVPEPPNVLLLLAALLGLIGAAGWSARGAPPPA